MARVRQVGTSTTFILAALVLAVVSWVAYAADALDGFILFATLGTAIGTLGLARYTYQLARATVRSVEDAERMAGVAEDQLVELKKQRDIIATQAERAGEQAEATRRLADAASVSATEAAKVRIDATAPLVHLRVAYQFTQVIDAERAIVQRVRDTDQWYEAQLRGLVFEVLLNFHFRNVGSSPALLAFSSAAQLENVSQGRLSNLALDPDETYEGVLIVRFAGEDAKSARLIDVPVTYEGLLHGEMFDHVQWNGWVKPLSFADGIAMPQGVRGVLGSAGARVVRSYPNLEHPEMMADGRVRLLHPHDEAGAP